MKSSITMDDQDKPTDLAGLFAFYKRELKPLYSDLSADCEPPLEILLEVHAAFDHISRKWTEGETEQQVVSTAVGHLKRATLDGYKIIARDTKNDYAELREIDTSIIDNGQYDQELIALWAEIKRATGEARCSEGFARNASDWHLPFVNWKKVHKLCSRFRNDFYLSKSVEWAKKKHRKRGLMACCSAFIVGVVTGVIGNAIWAWMSKK